MVQEVSRPAREEAPSQGWGWHGRFRHGPVVAGWVTVVFFLGIVADRVASGHYITHVPDIVLVAIAVTLAVLLIRQSVRRRRDVTAGIGSGGRGAQR